MSISELRQIKFVLALLNKFAKTITVLLMNLMIHSNVLIASTVPVTISPLTTLTTRLRQLVARGSRARFVPMCSTRILANFEHNLW